MPKQVVNLAQTKCSQGSTPSVLIVLPTNRVMSGFQPAANIMDHKPMVNVMPFGMCKSMANPMVAGATAAAQGVLTPMPCIPNTPAPWTPGASDVMLGFMPSLDDSCKLMCMWAGQIEVISPGQVTHQIP